MTATDELRRMLTDAGVKYFGVDEYTTYWDGILDGTKWGIWRAFEYDGLLHIMFSDDGDFVTPQEAIAATVGRVTCKRVMDSIDPFAMWVCDHCGHPLDTSENFCGGCGRKVVDE